MKKFSIAILLAAVVTVVVGSLLWHQYQRFLETPLRLPQQGVVLEIQPGMNLNSLGRLLQRNGWSSQTYFLKLLGYLDPDQARIKAGEYRLESGTTPSDLVRLLVSGKTLSYSITLIEGITFKELMKKVNSNSMLRHDLAGLTQEQIMARVGHPGEFPEGRFFPDTYLFPKGFSDLDLLRRAYQRMQEVLQSAWAGRDRNLPLKSPYEALILASIVEKETGAQGERAQIAGVFVRRLRKRMRLQTDPTVIYGMGDRYHGNIRRQDLRQPTPYNTYVINGLPPTPICMPGAAAIRAVMHPAAGKALYFVAKGDGSHQFSATLRQHNAAVRKYQLKK